MIQPISQQLHRLGSWLDRSSILRRVLLLLLILGILLPQSAAEAQTSVGARDSFAERFTVNERGDIRISGNTLLTCPATASNCLSARNGANVPNSDNNAFEMQYVDVDGDPNTFNSSSSTLSLPAGSTVLWAGLYWGADTSTGAGGQAAPNAEQRYQVRFSGPTGDYGIIQAQADGRDERLASIGSPNSDGVRYQGFRDVTDLIPATGNGTYTVANVQAGTGRTNGGLYAGWALVVVYANEDETFRNLTVFDGFPFVTNDQRFGESVESIQVSGFITPAAGAFETHIGSVVYEGDRGLTLDSIALNGVALQDERRSSDNFFNSSINDSVDTHTPSDIARDPTYVNQLGYDIALLDAPNILGNNERNANVTFSTSGAAGGDTYFAGVLTFAIDTRAPALEATKTVVDLNGGQVNPGDVLEYTIVLTNRGDDAAINLILANDPVPTETTYVPDSLEIVSGSGVGRKTDVTGDDQAEFDNSINQVIARLGEGANATSGGRLPVGQSTSFRFRVRINPTAPREIVISNQAELNYVGETLGGQFSTLTDGDITVPGLQPTETPVDPALGQAELSLTKVVDNPVPNVGENLTYTITLTNNGPDDATSIFVSDPLPSGLTFVSATSPSPNTVTYDDTTRDIVWSVPALSSTSGSNSTTLQVIARADSTEPATNTAVITSLDQDDPDLTNNQSSVTVSGSTGDDTTGLRLVKRITNVTRGGTPISGVNFGAFVDDPTDPNDTVAGWQPNFLTGVTNIPSSVPLQSGDVVEYTIYFLAEGATPVLGANFCDQVPGGTAFVADLPEVGRGIVLNQAGTPVSLTNVNDADAGTFFSPLVPLPTGNACAEQANANGSVVVNAGDISNTPPNNYGFVRFQVRIQ